MIAKRINHKGQCDHAQTPAARRACRKALIAAATQQTQEVTVTQRYSMNIATIDGRPMYQVIDSTTGGVHYEARFPVGGMVDTLNAPAQAEMSEADIRGWYSEAADMASQLDEEDNSRQAERVRGELRRAREAMSAAGLAIQPTPRRFGRRDS